MAGPRLVPVDPTDFRADGFMVGCNRLRCAQCGQVVRHHQGVECRDVRKHLAALAQAADWAELPFLTHSAGRLYACACTGWLETSMRALAAPALEEGAPSLPWRCAGHPAAALPLEVDGERLSVALDLEPFVDRVLAGWAPELAPPPGPWFPAAWLCRVASRVAGTALEGPLDRAVARRVADAAGRGGALRFYSRAPRAAGFEAVLAFVEGGGTGAWATPYGQETTQVRVLDALGARLAVDPRDPRAWAAFCKELHEPGLVTSEDLDLAAGRDAQWLAQAAVELARAAPGRGLAVLDALSKREELVVIAGMALLRADVTPRDELTSWTQRPSHRAEPYALVLRRAAAAPL